MRLSEAMRLGAAMKPQAFGVIMTVNNDATCAIGAAIEGAGIPITLTTEPTITGNGRGAWNNPVGTQIWILPAEWHEVLMKIEKCPECTHEANIKNVIAHLNDTHLWSREKIADFVELLEPLPVEGITVDEEKVLTPVE